VSDCLTPRDQYFSYIMARKGYFSFDEMMVLSVLYLTNTPSWIFMWLAHRYNNPREDMSLHWNKVSWFSNDKVLRTVCFIEK